MRLAIGGAPRPGKDRKSNGHAAGRIPLVVRRERGSGRRHLCEINVGGARSVPDSSTLARIARTPMRNVPGRVP